MCESVVGRWYVHTMGVRELWDGGDHLGVELVVLERWRWVRGQVMTMLRVLGGFGVVDVISWGGLVGG